MLRQSPDGRRQTELINALTRISNCGLPTFNSAQLDIIRQAAKMVDPICEHPFSKRRNGRRCWRHCDDLCLAKQIDLNVQRRSDGNWCGLAMRLLHKQLA